jgi:hypothetical protein
MATGRQNKLTGQIAEHLVCAELGRRGFIATPFASNVPTFDVVAVDATCRTVPIQVKATRGNTWPTDARSWMSLELDSETGVQHYGGPRTLDAAELVYVCVVLRAPGDVRVYDGTTLAFCIECMKSYATSETDPRWSTRQPSVLVPGEWVAAILGLDFRLRTRRQRSIRQNEADRLKERAAGLPDP